ncbi:Hypothetical protein NCS54_00037300 [Fusarium falciforme]|uniref:Pyridoxamine 5'-phosphate oxidase N-terminal domain-containing protein n=1 Tax=Fusarium falciforme TaxID=195108 RepID=A0A9W8R5K8_9HYPO|nr:Hypothetical protein NCS54_00037300 [Fusarium falciforme]KAJ4186067.1 hypothetical protein NW755_007919 [Fusarium falciforme]KAJ4254104.1 hypothetical protein NW757_005250 [Fusarium falciforme]WAO83190.1 Hypothetical protein NCS54_00037300 [Fusarium falciforme]
MHNQCIPDVGRHFLPHTNLSLFQTTGHPSAFHSIAALFCFFGSAVTLQPSVILEVPAFHIIRFYILAMKLYPSITEELAEWVQRQPVFFTGSAPTLGSHINVSPKGLADSHFAILGPNQCAYIDRTGSGCETIAHSYDNGRLCLMFMSFGAAPRILRFFCRSRVVEWDEPAFADLVRRISQGKRSAFDGARAVIVADVFEVQTSCGFGVPRVKRAIYDRDSTSEQPVEQVLPEGVDGKVDELVVFEERPTMDAWLKKRVDSNTLQEYHNETNVLSMDGLPGLKAARRGVGERLWWTDAKAHAKRVLAQGEAIAVGFIVAVLLYVVMNVVGAKTLGQF